MESLTSLVFHATTAPHPLCGLSLLHSACIESDFEMARNIITFSPTTLDTLIALRVQVQCSTSIYNGMTPVDILKYRNTMSHQRLAKLLNECSKGMKSMPLILVSARIGTVHHVRRIIATDVNAVSFHDNEFCTPLHYAAGHNTIEFLQVLISKGANVFAKDCRGYKAIHYAAWNGRTDNLVYLLEKESKQVELATLLHLAALRGHTTTVAALLSLGVEVDVRCSLMNPFGNAGVYCYKTTPCMMAALKGHLNTFEFLLEKGADIFACDQFGRSVVMCAVQGGNTDIICKLLSAGVEIQVRSASGQSLLHYARQPDVAELLLQRGLDVNARTNRGRTPLHFAVERADSELVAFLISHGAH